MYLKYFYFLPFLLALLFCYSCKDSTADKPSSNTPAITSSSQYPPLPAERIQELGTSTIIDYLFYQLPISMNLNEPSSIQSTLTHLTIQAPAQTNCKSPIGRVFYLREGETLIEADIFFEKGCAYLVFIENGKPAYANNLSPLGIQFLQGSIKQSTGVLIEP